MGVFDEGEDLPRYRDAFRSRVFVQNGSFELFDGAGSFELRELLHEIAYCFLGVFIRVVGGRGRRRGDLVRASGLNAEIDEPLHDGRHRTFLGDRMVERGERIGR